MCYNCYYGYQLIFQIKHQYRLTSETGPAHKKVFTVTLRLGDSEEYTAEVSLFSLNYLYFAFLIQDKIQSIVIRI